MSILVHLGIVAVVELPSPDDRETADREAPEQLNVDYVPVAEEPEPPETDESTADSETTEEEPTADRPEPEEQKKEEEEEQKKKQKQERESFDRKAVVQETNQEQPDEAEFVSEQSNRVEEETRARETVQDVVEPNSESGPDDDREESQRKVASKKPAPKTGSRKSRRKRRPTPESKEQPAPDPEQPESTSRPDGADEPEQTAPDEQAPGPEAGEEQPESEASEASEGDDTETPSRPLPTPSVGDYDEVFAGEDQEAIERHRNSGVGSEMFERLEKSDGAVEAATENYIPEVQPGNHTAVNAKSDAAATYVNEIHSKIHPLWGGDYLMELESSYGPSHPLSDPSLNAELELVVDAETGELETVNVVRSSGYTVYDMEAMEIVRQVAPNPEAPEAIVSPDGNVYLHWNFWRNQRQCGTFGVSVFKKTGEGEKEVRPQETK